MASSEAVTPSRVTVRHNHHTVSSEARKVPTEQLEDSWRSLWTHDVMQELPKKQPRMQPCHTGHTMAVPR